MLLKSLLTYANHKTKMTIVNESGDLIDKGTNGLTIRSLWGDKKVVMFKAMDVNELFIVVEGETQEED